LRAIELPASNTHARGDIDMKTAPSETTAIATTGQIKTAAAPRIKLVIVSVDVKPETQA
jgi:hypothetical protein